MYATKRDEKVPNRGKYILVITKHGQCPYTDTLGKSENTNPIKKCLMNKIFILI